MAGTLQDIRELEALIESRGDYGITKQDILDLLKSQAKVGGVLFVNDGVAPDQEFVIQPGWNRVDVWERGIDTQGLQDGLNDATDPGGWYHVKPAGAGDYSFSAALRLQVSEAGTYRMRVAHILEDATVNLTPFQDEVYVPEAGVVGLVVASGIEKNVERDERLQLELKGPNGATVLVRYGQFGVWR